jgi:hypothetical protein
MSLTYHHYGATVLNAPISQLQCNLYAILNLPQDIMHAALRATGSAALAESSQTCVQPASQISDIQLSCKKRPTAWPGRTR